MLDGFLIESCRMSGENQKLKGDYLAFFELIFPLRTYTLTAQLLMCYRMLVPEWNYLKCLQE